MPGYPAHVALVYGTTGQVLEFYPPPSEVMTFGPPVGVGTYAVWRGEDGMDQSVQFTGTAAWDTTSTTTDGICGPSQARRDRIPLTSTSGVAVGRRYLLTSNGRRLVVTVVAIASGDYVDVDGDIPLDFASGSLFTGLRYTFTVDPTFIATVTNINVFGSRITVGPGTSGGTQTSAPPYKVRWTYVTGDGLVRHAWTTFDVCRAPAKHTVTLDDLKEAYPELPYEEWLGQRGQAFQPQIRASWDRVRWDIRMAGYDVDMLSLDLEVLNRLTLMATLAQVAKLGCHPPERDATDWAAECEAAYLKTLNDSVTVTLKAWVQTDASGAIALETSEQLWLRR